LQGRFPIRVELQSLTVEDFIKILTEPKSSLTKQYIALLDTEGLKLEFTTEALAEVANFAFRVNEGTEKYRRAAFAYHHGAGGMRSASRLRT